MTYGRVLRNEGKKAGRREGRQEAIRENILGMYQVGIDPNLIARGMHTPLEEVNRILRA